jgi:hypothetical protein
VRLWMTALWIVTAFAVGVVLVALGFALAVVYFSECTCLVGIPL